MHVSKPSSSGFITKIGIFTPAFRNSSPSSEYATPNLSRPNFSKNSAIFSSPAP